MPQLTVCPSCAERRDPEDKFCGNCGASLATGPAAPPPPPPVVPPAGSPPAAAAERRPWQPPAATPAPRAATHDESPSPLPQDESPSPAVPGPTRHDAPVHPVSPPGVLGADGRPPFTLPGSADPAPGAGPEPDADAEADPTGSYLLPPPAPAAAPSGPLTARTSPAQPSVAAPAGVADPREDLLAPTPEQPRCVACGTGAVDADGYCERCGHAQPKERDHMECEVAGIAAVTDRGLRHHRNEDAFALAEATLPDGTPAAIAVVCDGVSSAARPDEASAAAARAAGDRLHAALSSGTRPREAMYDALLTAAESVSSLADPAEDNAPACTCVSAVVTGDLVTVGWVGDSRAYWIPDDRAAEQPARLTEDDSWAARMVEAGLMSEAQAYADERAHAITGWLGADAVDLDPHTVSFQPDRPGVIVVCTDGLWNYAESAAELADAVGDQARTRPLSCARALVGLALDGGGHDNITVAVLPFSADGEHPDGSAAAQDPEPAGTDEGER